MSADYKAKAAVLDDALSKIENVLLLQFQEQGMESVKTKHGTAYKSTRNSAGVADWDQVLAYVQQNDLWNLLEHRVSKQAVEEIKAETGELPPGVNWRSEVTINIRRS